MTPWAGWNGFGRHATPVARERNPTAPRVPTRRYADTTDYKDDSSNSEFSFSASSHRRKGGINREHAKAILLAGSHSLASDTD